MARGNQIQGDEWGGAMYRYLFGVPIVAALHVTVCWWLFETALGFEGRKESIAAQLLFSIPLLILSFPAMPLGLTPLGEIAREELGENGAILLFAIINGILWGFFLIWIIGVIVRRFLGQANYANQQSPATPN
jgi:hypothetical protein